MHYRRHRAFAAGLIEVRLERKETFQRRVGAIALVAIAADILGADFFSGFLIQHSPGDAHGRDFAGEKSLLLGARGALLAF